MQAYNEVNISKLSPPRAVKQSRYGYVTNVGDIGKGTSEMSLLMNYLTLTLLNQAALSLRKTDVSGLPYSSGIPEVSLLCSNCFPGRCQDEISYIY